MKPDTHLGENARQIEVSDDQQRRSFYAEFKREAADLMLDQGYSHIEACRSLGVVRSRNMAAVSFLALPHAPEHEPPGKLLGKCADGACVSQSEN